MDLDSEGHSKISVINVGRLLDVKSNIHAKICLLKRQKLQKISENFTQTSKKLSRHYFWNCYMQLLQRHFHRETWNAFMAE